MFIFRGVGRLVLNSKTVAIQDPAFLNIFTAYIKIPGLDDGDTKLSALIVGIVAAVCIVLNTVKNRRERAKKGYHQNSAFSDYIKSGLIAALLLYYCHLLSQYRGISVMLVRGVVCLSAGVLFFLPWHFYSWVSGDGGFVAFLQRGMFTQKERA